MTKKLCLNNHIDIDYAEKMFSELYKMTGINVVLVENEDFEQKLFNDDKLSIDFCSKIVKNTKEGSKRCNECVKNFACKIMEVQGICKMYCHAGLTNYAVPVKIEDKHVAYLMFGQARDKKTNLNKLKSYAKELGIDENKYIEAYEKITIIPEDKWKYAIKYLVMVGNLLSSMATEHYRNNEFKKRESIARFTIEAISSSFKFEEILDIICHELVKLFDINRASVVKFYKNEDKCKTLMSNTKDKNYKLLAETVTAKQYGEICKYWRSRLKEAKPKKAKIIDMFSEDVPQKIKDYHIKANIYSCIASLVAEDDESWTLMLLQEYKKMHNWSPEDINFLTILSKHISIALTQSQLYNEVLQKAETATV